MTHLVLSTQQKDAIQAISHWYNHPVRLDKKAFILNGQAGTGKTSIARLLGEMVLNAGPEAVLFSAFTGKASVQLRKKGCENVTTLHKLLYSPMEKDRTRLLEIIQALRHELTISSLGDSDKAIQLKRDLYLERKRVATPSWQAKKLELNSAIKLIVVDESSQIDNAIYNDLLAIGLPIVFIGDPFQLPPVFGTSPVMQQEPDFVLTEVHRQALDNPVLRAATELRAGEYPAPMANQDKFQIIPWKDASYETYAQADQVLCGRNKTRQGLNAKLRKRLVEKGEVAQSELAVAQGDRVVFLRNDHDEQVFNGTIAKVISVTSGADEGHDNLIIDGEDDGGNKILGYEAWPGVIEGLDMHEAPHRTQVVDHAYALTVHKSQGSEWNSVCVHQEPIGHGIDAMRWLYTAITRAQDRCVVVTKET